MQKWMLRDNSDTQTHSNQMRDLFSDNIALTEHLEALPSHRTPTRTPETREVGVLDTWVTTFATYIVVVAVAHPGRVRDMLAYMCLVVRKAQKLGATGWLTYDQVFCQIGRGQTRGGINWTPPSILHPRQTHQLPHAQLPVAGNAPSREPTTSNTFVPHVEGSS